MNGLGLEYRLLKSIGAHDWLHLPSTTAITATEGELLDEIFAKAAR